jgi:hypothetical protein
MYVGTRTARSVDTRTRVDHMVRESAVVSRQHLEDADVLQCRIASDGGHDGGVGDRTGTGAAHEAHLVCDELVVLL